MYQQVLVSPEIASSGDFRRQVLLKNNFASQLRVMCINEAHCITVWGGSFRPEYETLGALQGRISRLNVPLLVASATLPEHILDDIRSKLKLSKDTKYVGVTNDHPNVALSVRTMKYSEESKADLRFLIPEGATTLEAIIATAIFCNQRGVAEDICDALRFWARQQGIEGAEQGIVFYHTKIGSKRKREIEEGIRNGTVRLLVCTDAVGMVSTLIILSHSFL